MRNWLGRRPTLSNQIQFFILKSLQISDDILKLHFSHIYSPEVFAKNRSKHYTRYVLHQNSFNSLISVRFLILLHYLLFVTLPFDPKAQFLHGIKQTKIYTDFFVVVNLSFSTPIDTTDYILLCLGLRIPAIGLSVCLFFNLHQISTQISPQNCVIGKSDV